MQRATEKLKLVVPLTILMVFLLVYPNFGHLTGTLIVMLSIPFSLVGGMVSATILTLIIFPAVYAVVKEIPLRRIARK